jgi:hypothetical protein
MPLRLVLWSLADSKTTLDELRTRLPDLAEGDLWISDEATERFGLVATSDDPIDLGELSELIGKQPDLGEEFEVES